MRFGKFTNYYRDVTKEGTKIPQEKYCLTGQYPIVDQGQRVIAGWWNDDDGIFKDVPAIIFGDHTRAIKYMEEPFFIGADGVKILRPTNVKDNPKYLYYALQAAKIPNLGYSRHFKVVKELEIRMYSRDKQDEIVRVLEKIDYLIEQRHAETTYLDQLVKSRFIELFGDPMTDVSKWSASTIGEQFNVSSGGTPATGEKAYWENGTIPWIGSNMCQDTMLSENDGKFITEEGYAHSSAKWFHKGTVLVALVGATIGKTALLRFDTTTNQNIAAIDETQNAAFSSEFVFYHMQMLYSKFMEIGSGKFKMANQGFIRQLPLICPPIELQEQFAAFVEQTDKSKYYSSLSFRYCQAAANTYRQEWMTCRTSDF